MAGAGATAFDGCGLQMQDVVADSMAGRAGPRQRRKI